MIIIISSSACQVLLPPVACYRSHAVSCHLPKRLLPVCSVAAGVRAVLFPVQQSCTDVTNEILGCLHFLKDMTVCNQQFLDTFLKAVPKSVY